MRGILLAFTLLACGTAMAGDVYRWVDDHGKVFYSDQPPPPSAKKAEKFKSRANVIEVDKESYGLRQARQLSPVVLYVSDCGQICDQATDFLQQRDVPFSRRDPSQEPEIALELKKLTGATDVPVILVGSSHFKGFEALTWNRLLDAANYPKAGERKANGSRKP